MSVTDCPDGIDADLASRQTRVALTAAVATLGVVISFMLILGQDNADIDQVYHGARAWLAGRDPYAEVGPGRRFELAYGLYYPLPALIVGMPLALLPIIVARSVFYGLSAGLMAWIFSRDKNDPRILLIVSGAFLFSASVVQWEPLLVAATLMPSLGFLLAAKPSVGLALWIAYPTRRAALGVAVIVALSFLLMPDWLQRWTAEVSASPTIRPLAWHPIGWLALLALVRWRDPDARLVAALSIVPLTPLPYSAVLLFPAVRSAREALVLIIGSWLAIAVHWIGYPYASDVERLDYMRGVFALTCTLPMTAMLFLRPYFARRSVRLSRSEAERHELSVVE